MVFLCFWIDFHLLLSFFLFFGGCIFMLRNSMQSFRQWQWIWQYYRIRVWTQLKACLFSLHVFSCTFSTVWAKKKKKNTKMIQGTHTTFTSVAHPHVPPSSESTNKLLSYINLSETALHLFVCFVLLPSFSKSLQRLEARNRDNSIGYW